MAQLQNCLDEMPPIPNGQYYIISHNSGYVLDVSGGSHEEKAKIIQHPLHGGTNQIFKLMAHKNSKTGDYDGYYAIECMDSGNYWDILSANTKDYGELIQYKYHGSDNQLFKFESLGNGLYRILCKHSGKALDIRGGSKQAGAACIQYKYHGGANQRFRVLSAKQF